LSPAANLVADIAARGALLVDFEQGITRGHFALNAFQIRIDFDDLLMYARM